MDLCECVEQLFRSGAEAKPAAHPAVILQLAEHGSRFCGVHFLILPIK